MKNNLLPITKGGWIYILASIVFFILFYIFSLNFLSSLAFLSVAFFIYVFRNPERESILYQENSVVSPVDGIVVSIEELSDSNMYKIDIDSTYLDISLLRAPFASFVKQVKVNHGARLGSQSNLSKDINENSELIFTNKSMQSIKIIHRLKQSFKAIDIDVVKDQNLSQGSRYGFMLFGITTLYLPRNFRLNVSVGSELRASETLIGYFTLEKK